MKNRDSYYESVAEEIFSKNPGMRLSFIQELQKRDEQFYSRMKHLVHKIESDDSVLSSKSGQEIRRILKELNE